MSERPKRTRKFVSPIGIVEQAEKHFKNIIVEGRKSSLSQQDVEDILSIRDALAETTKSGLLKRPPYRALREAYIRCGGDIALLNTVGKLARMKMTEQGRRDPANVLLATASEYQKRQLVLPLF